MGLYGLMCGRPFAIYCVKINELGQTVIEVFGLFSEVRSSVLEDELKVREVRRSVLSGELY